MPVIHTKVFDRTQDPNLIVSFDSELSEYERRLRFTYASLSLLGYINHTYARSYLDFPVRGPMPYTTDFSLWYSRKGTLLSTEVTRGPHEIAWDRIFKKDPLYATFGNLPGSPIHRLAVTVESAGDAQDEFARMIKLFENRCSDTDWKQHFPRLLIDSNSSRRNGK